MGETETGWTTEWPVVNGVYWARWQSTVSVNTFIVEVIGKRFYMTGRSLICPNHETPAPYEWLGPVSPSDAEQLMELRSAAEEVLSHIPTRRGYIGLSRAADRLRAALNPSQAKEGVNDQNSNPTRKGNQDHELRRTTTRH